MAGLCVLLTNRFLRGQSGTEMYVHDVALKLLARGHRPIVYSPLVGSLAQRLSTATISVVDDLAMIQQQPDVIHGQHSLETLEALLHFPTTPAIYVCHDWNWVHDTPPKLSRVRRYVAADETVRERLVVREGIEPSQVEVIFNGVDLTRFQPRPSLPPRPRRALAISNYLEPGQVEVIAAACRQQEIELDAIGAQLGGTCPRPEEVLGQYDLVFGKARCAWESLAVGTAVIVCDTWGVGQLVTSPRLEAMRRANFGRRLLQQPLTADVLAREIAGYDAADAAEVSRQIRVSASVETMVDRLMECYEAAIAAQREASADLVADMRAAAAFLRAWSPPDPSLEPAPLVKCVPVDVERFRWIVREELERERRIAKPQRVTGLRKWARSLQKRGLLPPFLRRAA